MVMTVVVIVVIVFNAMAARVEPLSQASRGVCSVESCGLGLCTSYNALPFVLQTLPDGYYAFYLSLVPTGSPDSLLSVYSP